MAAIEPIQPIQSLSLKVLIEENSLLHTVSLASMVCGGAPFYRLYIVIFILSIPVIFTTLIIFMAHIKGKSGYHGMLIILKSAYLMLPTNSFNSKINKITNKFKE